MDNLQQTFLNRYGIIDRLKEDLKKEKIEKSEAALAAAVIYSEYFKSQSTKSLLIIPVGKINWS